MGEGVCTTTFNSQQSGRGCLKLTTLFVNVSLKFKT